MERKDTSLNCGTEQVAKNSPVEEALAKLGSEIMTLADKLSLLKLRLQPISICQGHKEPEEKIDCPNSSSLEKAIYVQASIITAITNTVFEMLEELRI